MAPQALYGAMGIKRHNSLPQNVKGRVCGDADSDSDDDRAPVPFNMHARSVLPW